MKRLISLTMAAACALSLAVPAFAAKTDVDNSGNVIIESTDTEKVEEAINSDDLKNDEIIKKREK